MNGKNNLVVTVLLVLAVICILMTLNVSLTGNIKKEGFENQQNNKNSNNLNNLSKDELYEKYQELKTSYDEILSGSNLSNYVTKTELKPSESQLCTVSKAVDRDLHMAKSSCSGSGPKVDLNDYVLKSSIPPERVCPPPKEIDYSKYVLKSSIPPPQKCPPCICPKVKVSAGLCKTCPPPPKCPAPAPCPVVNCPEPKACPPQKYCPAPKACSREKEVQVKYVQVPTVIQPMANQNNNNNNNNTAAAAAALLAARNNAKNKVNNNVSGVNSKLGGSNTINVGVEQEEDDESSSYSKYVQEEEYNNGNNSNMDLLFNNYDLNSKYTSEMGKSGVSGYKSLLNL